MATNRTFQDMLNEYLTYDLLKEEYIKRDYLLSKVDRDEGWKGGSLPVPFKGSRATSIKFGGLTAANDVSEDEYVRGTISTQPEIWGTMKFNHRDLLEHNGKVNEKSFLKLLPGALEDFMDYMKESISMHILSGKHLATGTGDGGIDGTIVVDRIERFYKGQKLSIKDDDTAAADVYVIAIDVNNNDLTVSATRGGAALDISAYTAAANTKFYVDGAESNGMSNLRSMLLSLANGGDANLYGKAKLSYPYLQAINIDGSAVTSTNILDKVFDAFTEIKNKGKGRPNTLVMSYKWLGHIMKKLESVKGPYKVVEGSTKASLYDWTEIAITGVKGTLTVAGVQEMDDDVIFFLDFRALKFHSNGFIEKRTAPDGKQYYEVRETTGYYYLTDLYLFGDMVLSRPCTCGVMHSIP